MMMVEGHSYVFQKNPKWKRVSHRQDCLAAPIVATVRDGSQADHLDCPPARQLWVISGRPALPGLGVRYGHEQTWP